MIILDNDVIDNIFLEKKGFIPIGGTGRRYYFKDFFYKPKRDIIFRPGNGNLFDEHYKEIMVHCKWCDFLGLEPIHPLRDIIQEEKAPSWSSCRGMTKYRNSIRTDEELKMSIGSRINENILRIWMEETGQQIYKFIEIKKYCLDTYGGCFKTGSKEFSIDHIKPLIMGYPLIPKNACPLKKEYNSAKRDRWPGNYYDEKDLIKLFKFSGYTIEELKTSQMNHPFFEWCYNNPFKWKNYVMEDRKYLQEHGGKEKFLKTFQKKIDESMTEQRNLEGVFDNL